MYVNCCNHSRFLTLHCAVQKNIVDDVLNALRSIVVRLYARPISIEHHRVCFLPILMPGGQPGT